MRKASWERRYIHCFLVVKFISSKVGLNIVMRRAGLVTGLLLLSFFICYLPPLSLPQRPLFLPSTLLGFEAPLPTDNHPSLENSSWERQMENDEFKRKVPYRREFKLLDDEEVKNMKGKLACVPFSFGYSMSRGAQLFPDYEYPPCNSLVQEPIPELKLNHTSQSFTMTCPANFTPYYTLNPSQVCETDQWLYSDLDPLWQTRVYPGSEIHNISSEFALGKCGSNGLNGVLEPRWNETAANRAKKIMHTKGATKPITIVLLTLDSFSRRHFYRKLPRTISLLSTLNTNSNFTIFDYKIHNVADMGSAGNMLQIFSNNTYFLGLPEEWGIEMFYGRLWVLMKEMGFVTMFGFEDCDHHFVGAFGKRLEVDNLVRTFYCGVRKYTGFSTAQNATEQRCIGREMSHTYLLNYTRKWMQMYEGLNQFIYLHIDTGHEYTGQHAATLDPDLAFFLQATASHHTQDLFLMLHGDHGMGFGSTHGLLEAGQEHKLPVLFVVASNGLLDSIPRAYDSLWHNSYRLISKRDLRATLLALSHLPYPSSPYNRTEEKYLSKAVVLFSEKVPDSRTCEDLGILGWCSCPDHAQEVPDPAPLPLTDLLHFIALEALEVINRLAYTPITEPLGLTCLRLTLKAVTKAFAYSWSGMLRLQIELTVWEAETANLETMALVTRSEAGVEGDKFVGNKERLVVEGEVVYIRVIYIKRRDKYAGLCEDRSRARGLPADLCICNSLPSIPNSS